GPAAGLAGPGCAAACWAICAGVCPATFFALSATSARFASGTAALTTAPAVPLSATKSESIATTSAAVDRFELRWFIWPSLCASRRLDARRLAGGTQGTLKHARTSRDHE